jgi:hypothetical protein
MSCDVEMEPRLIIGDDNRGYEEWEVGDSIHLILKTGGIVSGEIIEILPTELTINDDDCPRSLVISFENIEGYL